MGVTVARRVCVLARKMLPSPPSVRAYELARELRVDNEALLRALRAAGVAVKNHMTVLPEQVVGALRLGTRVVDLRPLYPSDPDPRATLPRATVRRRDTRPPETSPATADRKPETVAHGAARPTETLLDEDFDDLLSEVATTRPGWLPPPGLGPCGDDLILELFRTIPQPELRRVPASCIARAISADPTDLVALMVWVGVCVESQETRLPLGPVLSLVERHGDKVSPSLPLRAFALRVSVHLREHERDLEEAAKAATQAASLRPRLEAEYGTELSEFNDSLEHVYLRANLSFPGVTRDDIVDRIEKDLATEESEFAARQQRRRLL